MLWHNVTFSVPLDVKLCISIKYCDIFVLSRGHIYIQKPMEMASQYNMYDITFINGKTVIKSSNFPSD